MSKGKKIYCIASFAFACAVLILTITLCMMHPGRVYASSMDPDSITKITQKDTQGADHNTAVSYTHLTLPTILRV